MLTAYFIYSIWVVVGLGTAYHAIEKNQQLSGRHAWVIILFTWPLVLVRALIEKFYGKLGNR